MNLPNKLTLARIILVPFIIIFMLPIPFGGEIFAGWNNFVVNYGHFPAALLFVIASLTDMFDGKIARSRGLVTNLGKFLDPIADKLLIISVLTVLVQQQRIHSVIAIIIIIREFVVTAIRLVASDNGKVIAASKLGKTKTLLQMVAITFLMLEKPIVHLLAGRIDQIWITRTGDFLLFLAVIMTLTSGFDYLFKNINFLKEAK
ncbi:MAG: CDP-diacylglycerol--glycerol-3-phosphate 3-phosphatidyltransferase [Saccharofermentanales bacterium]